MLSLLGTVALLLVSGHLVTGGAGLQTGLQHQLLRKQEQHAYALTTRISNVAATASNAAKISVSRASSSSSSSFSSVKSASAVVTAAATTAPPAISDEFTAQFNMSVSSQSIFVSQLYPLAEYAESHTLQRTRLSLISNSSFLPGFSYRMNTTMLIADNTSYSMFNGECRSQPGYFNGMFDFLRSSHYAGNHTVNGVETQAWNLYVGAGSREGTNLTLYWSQDQKRPIRYDIYLPNASPFLPGMNTSEPEYIVYNFTKWKAGALPPNIVAVPESCLAAPPLCAAAAGGVFQKRLFVLAQPTYNTSLYDITNQNTADWLGDALFVCGDVLSNHTQSDQYSVVSLFEVEVDTRWGQYALCNGYPGQCLGLETHSVGREASFGANTEDGGQCSPNANIGSWYSFPKAGKCPADAPIGTEGCTWRISKRVRTISLQCLMEEQGMRKACVADKGLPLTQTLKIFEAAMTKTPQAGGCSDIPPPPSSAV